MFIENAAKCLRRSKKLLQNVSISRFDTKYKRNTMHMGEIITFYCITKLNFSGDDLAKLAFMVEGIKKNFLLVQEIFFIAKKKNLFMEAAHKRQN